MATSQVQTVSTSADKAKLGGAAVLAVAALAAFYLLAKQGPWAQWGVLLLGMAAATGVFFTSESGKALLAFGRDAWREVKKSGLARAQGGNTNDRLCVRVCAGDGGLSLAD